MTKRSIAWAACFVLLAASALPALEAVCNPDMSQLDISLNVEDKICMGDCVSARAEWNCLDTDCSDCTAMITAEPTNVIMLSANAGCSSPTQTLTYQKSCSSKETFWVKGVGPGTGTINLKFTVKRDDGSTVSRSTNRMINVLNVDIAETNEYKCVKTASATLNLTGDSYSPGDTPGLGRGSFRALGREPRSRTTRATRRREHTQSNVLRLTCPAAPMRARSPSLKSTWITTSGGSTVRTPGEDTMSVRLFR